MAVILVASTAWTWTTRPGNDLIPVATADLTAGRPLSEAAVEWREVPAGTLSGIVAVSDLRSDRILTRDVPAGEPITRSAIGAGVPVPDDWWAVPVDLPDGARIGDRVRIVLSEPAQAADGVVIHLGRVDAFEPVAGLVAVPHAVADTVARAAARQGVAVLLPASGAAPTGG